MCTTIIAAFVTRTSGRSRKIKNTSLNWAAISWEAFITNLILRQLTLKMLNQLRTGVLPKKLLQELKYT
jgi:hypothetical protein